MIGEIGFRIETEIVRASKESQEKLASFSSALLSDGMNKFYTMRSDIHQLFNSPKMIGTALTVKTRSADNLMVHKAVSLIKPGDILVIDTQGCTNYSLLGELLVSGMKKMGLAGIVTDGCVRDIRDLQELGIPVFAYGVIPAVGDKDGPGEINVPICCGGVVVMPGDIIVGDADGVVVVPKNDVDAVVGKASVKAAYEEKRRKDIEEGNVIKADIDLQLAQKGLKFISSEK